MAFSSLLQKRPELLLKTQDLLRKRWLFLGGIAILIAFAAVAINDGRLSRVIKRWHSQRLAQQALSLLAREDNLAATAKVRNALQFDFQNNAAALAAARLLSHTGQYAVALEWWRKVAAQGPLTPPDRRDYASAALGSGSLDEAERQIRELLKLDAQSLPADWLLSAQLAARREDGVRALDVAERVLADARTAPHERMATALLIYSMTAPGSPPYLKAWDEFGKLASDAANPMSLDALVFMARQPGAIPATRPADVPILSALTAGSESSASRLSLPQIADALEHHPKARPYHQLLALECRAANEPAATGELLGTAIDRFGRGDDETLTELGSWLYRSGRFEMLLQTVPLERALKQQNLFLQRLDGLSALGRFPEVVDLLQSQRFPLDPVLEHIYLAIARNRMDEPTGANNEWQRALESADTVPKLMTLASFAERASFAGVAEKAYAAASGLEPNNRLAGAGRLRMLLQQGRTTHAFTAAGEIARQWPDDAAARNDTHYLGLLLHDPSVDPAAAEREAEALVLNLPSNWPARATLALVRLQQGRLVEALHAFDGVKATGNEPPGTLAVRAAVLAANGWIDGAKNDAHNLASARLLPEERALIAPLTASDDR